jgi:formylglycine-generating enzyme required for sulfatase activity
MQEVRVFLSSPGDVEEEQKKAASVVAQINRMFKESLNLHVELVNWKTHVVGDMGRPQKVINDQIGDYDIFVGIMWKRFGSHTGVAESGTKEEFNIAYTNWEKFKRPRILFYFSQVPHAPKLDEIEQWKKVLEFKENLLKKGLIKEYNSTDEFADLLRENLAKILQKWFSSDDKQVPVADFNRYLNYLKKETMHIDIRGLVTGEGKAHRFRIDELYIPLQTTGAGLSSEKDIRKAKSDPLREENLREILLQEALKEPRLIIKGDPGAGKTTFLRLITFILSGKWLGEEEVQTGSSFIWPGEMLLPVLIRVGRLSEHIREWKKNHNEKKPVYDDSPEWLLHFLEKQSLEFGWDLSAEHFRNELKAGRCLILLDGLDEAPDSKMREKIGSFTKNLFMTYSKCHIVLTSRPAALTGKAVPLDFTPVEIAPLDIPAMDQFLMKWCRAAYSGDEEKACKHKEELGEALKNRPEIRRMAKTPVMLTALAVVHWNEHRLPEQRAELYESIIIWLLRTREQRPGRMKAERCRSLLQKLAMAMFIHPEGRQRQVGLGWAADTLSSEFTSTNESSPVEQAKYFIRDEVVDSGIIAERSHRIEFWHLSFQEYLAACEIAGLLEKEQSAMLFKKNRLYSSEWHELVLLLGGVLYKQGRKKIEYLIDSIINHGAKDKNALPELAKKVGLLGGIVRDLSPFDFQPANTDYAEIVRSVMGIFDKNVYQKIHVKTRIAAADALAQVGDPRFADETMITIPAGKFWMGAQKRDSKGRNFDEEAYEGDLGNEFPVHEVELSAFRIGKYPVMVGQYLRFIEDGGYEEKEYWIKGGFGKFKQPDEWDDQVQYPSRPVVNVSWYEVSAYACWSEGRLPTEAEWERAARGTCEKYRKYPWGNKEPDGETANFHKSSIGHVTPVGIFPENCTDEGIIDLAGNCWEWCSDRFSEDYYQECIDKKIDKDPKGPDKGKRFVVRGGSFSNVHSSLRCAFRNRSNPRVRDDSLGFRLVRPV